MLRAFVLAVGVVLAATGAILCVCGRTCAPGIQLLIMGVTVIVGVVFERWRYRRTDAQPPQGPQWQPTGERFVDPQSGKHLEVYYDPGSGERRYVESGAADQP